MTLEELITCTSIMVEDFMDEIKYSYNYKFDQIFVDILREKYVGNVYKFESLHLKALHDGVFEITELYVAITGKPAIRVESSGFSTTIYMKDVTMELLHENRI